MTHFIGIDVGTSAVKIVLVDGAQTVLAEHEAPLAISRPRPDWSEQDPDAWCDATAALLDRLARDEPTAMSGVGAIGLSGQMHGAVAAGRGRPAPATGHAVERWPRSSREHSPCARAIPICLLSSACCRWRASPAPRCRGLARHEPGILPRLRTVMLPKDFVRLMLTGEKATDVSDAAGTWWLDEARRTWSREAADATGLPFAALPPILESAAVAGMLWLRRAARWGSGTARRRRGGSGRRSRRSDRHWRDFRWRRLPVHRHLRPAFRDHRKHTGRRPRPPCTPSLTRCPAAGSRWARC